ncbi:tyrosine-type recombinase/integrase [Catenulispora sp. NL8]|uniref:Tyrosine-type recombinase/integrase n=1 Tax=Catenulispora pinistramenti TaxID=2705254 RepID=A0ABS5KMX2_9ACTN|nr:MULTISPECIES: tyrosine-type recombinase/integrase [Catenulispora]MBS2547413.1 tyrosine-type recombinase/integrase [Catenulispora pinistramenti]
MDPSYDVHIWSIQEYKGKKRTTHRLRWLVAGRTFTESFVTSALAEAFRAKLLTAAREGFPFDTETGLPEHMIAKKAVPKGPTVYEHLVEYAEMKWPRLAPNSRSGVAETLAVVAPVLSRDLPGRPDPVVLRRALYRYAFNFSRSKDTAPQDVTQALDWIVKSSIPLKDLADAMVVRKALDALSLKMDGSAAAAKGVTRKRAVFYNALGYAVELKRLPTNPINEIGWRAPRTTEVVDRRVVVNPVQARALLSAVEKQGRYGKKLVAFFALMYFAALRPSEAKSLREDQCELPEQGWGTLHLAKSAPRAGSAWTDNGKPHEERGLKHRAVDDVRPVPACPELVKILRDHVANFPPRNGGPLFVAARGGVVNDSIYTKTWRDARFDALTARQFASPMAKRPYDLRHAAVSTWLNAGVPPTQIAEWAGHSVEVLLRVYAKCIDGQDEVARRRIEDALGGPDGA